jgi:1-acyl-sn-glycerol-3-phosphate acyltransferase
MLRFLPKQLKGVLAFLFYAVNTIILCVVLFIAALFKLTIPIKAITILFDHILITIATLWITINAFTSDLFCKIDWDVKGAERLEKKEWYLVLSNHQSWVDILSLQTALNRKVPMLKFFLKRELIWVPFLGLAWWAMDFPFMKRYSKKQIEQNPHLKGKDLNSTKKACKKFKNIPVSIMNFVEGTRFTPEKKIAQKSPFKHLLVPRAGGIAFVLGSMGGYLNKIINVTIVYPGDIPSFWDYISGRVKKITIDFEVIQIEHSLNGDYFNDPDYKEKFCRWLNDLWEKKDKKIEVLKNNRPNNF